MLRFLSALALAGAASLVSLHAQVYTIQPRPITVDNRPKGGFSISFRYGGAATVSFQDVGTIASPFDIGDTGSAMTRIYNDGLVGLDSRGGQSTGSTGDDGRTNRWAYGYDSQITASGDIAFHQYSTASNGTDVPAETGSTAGIDMQYDMVMGVFGPKVTDKAWTFTWGLMAGGLFSPINAKTRGTVRANLVTVTDIYSLEGAAVPHADPVDLDGDGTLDYVPGYSAPSTTTITGKDADGNDVTYVIDNTTLINNRPYFRSAPTTTVDGAEVTGFWQVKGAYYSFRAGPWLRWQFFRGLSLRASLGATYSFLGVDLEYDEYVDTLESANILRAGSISKAQKNERFGVYSSLDAEWWVSDRTGFFAGLTYESTGGDVTVRSGDPAAGGRSAIVHLPNGTGFRAGISVLF